MDKQLLCKFFHCDVTKGKKSKQQVFFCPDTNICAVVYRKKYACSLFKLVDFKDQ